VDPARGTETFAEVTLLVSNLRWAGVPFTLRTGKALAHRRSAILVHFRAASHPTFSGAAAAPANLLRLGLAPTAWRFASISTAPAIPSAWSRPSSSAPWHRRSCRLRPAAARRPPG
jgi:glucose-6-phosphate 1-dehydrogenase